jgi:hypothetical protein
MPLGVLWRRLFTSIFSFTLFPDAVRFGRFEKWCGGRDLNPRITKNGILSPAPLARLDYPRLETLMS